MKATTAHPQEKLENTRAIEKPREMNSVLESYQHLSDRLGRIDERLGMIRGRLSGEVPQEVSAEGADPPQVGIISQLIIAQHLSSGYCESIEEWLNQIERVI